MGLVARAGIDNALWVHHVKIAANSSDAAVDVAAGVSPRIF